MMKLVLQLMTMMVWYMAPRANVSYSVFLVGVLVSFKRVKYFVTEGDEPAELCLEKLGVASSAVIVAVSSSNDSAFSMILLPVVYWYVHTYFFAQLHLTIRLYLIFKSHSNQMKQ